MPQGQSDSLPRIPLGEEHLTAGALSRGKAAWGVECRNSSLPKTVKMIGNSSVRLFCEQEDIQSSLVLQCRPLRYKQASGGDALKVEWPVGFKYAFPLPCIIQLDLGRLVK